MLQFIPGFIDNEATWLFVVLRGEQIAAAQHVAAAERGTLQNNTIRKTFENLTQSMTVQPMAL